MFVLCLKSGFVDNALVAMYFLEHPIIQSYHNESLFFQIIASLASAKVKSQNSNSGGLFQWSNHTFVTYLVRMFNN